MSIKSYWPQKNSRSRVANRDFGRRKFGNPLFRPPATKGTSWHQRQQRRREWHMPWRLLGTLAVLGLIGYGLWYVLWSPAFRITAVGVTGASPEVELAIRRQADARLALRSLYVFPQDNLLLLSTGSLRREIAADVYLETLAVSKRLPKALTITVTEKEPMVAAAVGQKLTVADVTGTVIRELTEGERIKLGELPPALQGLSDRGADTLVVSTREFDAVEATTAGRDEAVGAPPGKADEAQPKAELPRLPWPLVVLDEEQRTGLPAKVYSAGDAAVPPDAVKTVLAVQTQLKGAIGTTAKWYTSKPNGETIEVMTAEGWSAYLSTAKSVEAQLKYLKETLNRAVGKRRAELLYVDVRYDQKVFVRFKDQAEKPAAEKPPR